MVRRIYVEKKSDYAAAANELYEDLKGYLGLDGLKKVRILIRYDVEGLSDDVFDVARRCVFSEPPVDDIYDEDFPKEDGDRIFSVEYLPGQFDQRADSAVQCVQFLSADADPIIRTATTYCLSGNISDEEFESIRSYCINPVDSRETGFVKPDTLAVNYEEPEDIKIFDGFRVMSEEDLKKLNSITINNLEINTNKIKAQISTDKDLYITSPIPYSKGWTAYVDNQKVDILKANLMYMAIPVEKGNHTITYKYSTPLLLPGTIITLISSGFYIYLLKRKTRTYHI